MQEEIYEKSGGWWRDEAARETSSEGDWHGAGVNVSILFISLSIKSFYIKYYSI